MIELTRLNGTQMVLNSDLIKTAEESPDSMITLITGEKLIVLESCAEITARVLEYRSRLLASVAQIVPRGMALERAASISSLDLADPPSRRNRDDRQQSPRK